MNRLLAQRASPCRRALAGFSAVALLSTQLALPRRAEASPLGSSTASAGSVPPPSVSAIQSFQPDLFTGRATTSIPIAVPPGRKGMGPSLALTYSSSSRNGWLGVGWSLDLGYIERATKNGPPAYTAADAFTFMFQGVASDLVKIPDGTYRAEDEGLFLRFEPQGVSGWDVRDKSGTRYLFGGTPESELTTAGGTFRWCLRKVSDANGNVLTVSYGKDQGQPYPTRIDYTGHETSGSQDLAPVNTVQLVTESRPDVDVSYRSGSPIATALRLKEITATAQGQRAMSYRLTYAQSRQTGRSLLATVTQVGTDGITTLPATQLTYQDGQAPSYALSGNAGATSQVAWNARKAAHDFQHDVFSCGDPHTHPYASLNWTSPTVVSSSADLGCANFTVGSQGTINVSGCQDHYVHAWTWLHLSQAQQLSLSGGGFCVWTETAGGGVSLASNPTSVSLPAGWSILHLTAHHEHAGFSASEDSPLTPQVSLMSPSQFMKPQLAGDVDGNGITDLITFDAITGDWSVACSRSCNFSQGKTWLSNVGTSASTPVLGDWNADGRTDVAIFANGTWRFAISTATSFQADAIPPFTFGSGMPLTGDFNGDGRVDLGTYSNGTWSIALATGSGFASAGSFSLNWGTSAHEPLTGDFNADGFTDLAIITTSSGNTSVALSSGSVFVPQSSNWISAFGPNQLHTSADVNGDGLTDIAYYDKSSGQVRVASSTGTQFAAPSTLPVTFTRRSSDDSLQVGDFNGDGLADPAIVNAVTGAAELANSQGAVPDLLVTIANGIGGSTTLQYQPSTQCDNTCLIDGTPKLPFVLPLVNHVTMRDGMGTAYVSTYFFQQGRYDAPTKEFRGFGRAEMRDAEGNVAITEFLQDEHTKGRPSRTEFRDTHGALWTKSEQTWSAREPYPGVHFATLDQTDAYTYDGDATFKHTRARFTYDAYGNLTTTSEHGDVSISGDERTTQTTFAPNTSSWILNKPALAQTLDANGAVVAQRRFFYDGATDSSAPPTSGTLTKEEEWLNLPTEQWLATGLTYDAYGNVATITDALGRVTTNTYDATGTYLTTITNALSHSRQLVYDPRFGHVTSSTDQNGVTSTTEHDPLGRVMTVVGPNDTASLPTLRYEYDVGTVPTRTTVFARVQSGQPAELATYTFTDGLGRVIQTRSPAENPAKQVVAGAVEWNARALVVKQWMPYLSDLSTSYRPSSLEPSASSLASVTYAYDPLGRLIKTADPDGSTTTTSYDDWAVTATDANGHQTRRTQDAAGRLIQVEEFNDGQTATTTYQYDMLNNLLRVTDAAGNITTIAYDSLGRKLSMDDPDMGHWTYAYDAVDNLMSQTDARGVTTTFTYDTLNRLTRKSYAVPPTSNIQLPASVVYTYDGANDTTKPFTKGKLTGITDGSGSSSFEYDQLGRLIKEEKVVDGTRYTVNRSYDLLGRLTSLTYPDGDVATYTYNAQGGIETVRLQTSDVGQQSIVNDITYNAAGQLTKIVYGNGVVSDYSYNPQTLRLDALVTRHSSLGTTLQDFSYQFDATGNVTVITDRVYTGSQTFQYDDLNRLTTAIGSYGTLTYAYDPLGNLIDKEGATLTYGANGAGPHAVTSAVSTQQSALSMKYDGNGNLIEKNPCPLPLAPCPIAQTLKYDAENRLVEVASAQEESVTVTFQPGWNFFSLPVIPEDASVSAVFPTFAEDFEQLAKFVPASSLELSAFSHYVGNPKFDDFTTLEYGIGYQLYCKAAGPVTVTFQGKLPTRRRADELTSGWHLLPASTLQPSAFSHTFSGLDYDQLLAYDPAPQTLQPAGQVEAAQAYWVHLRTAGTFSPSLPRDPTTTFVYDGDGGRVKQTTASGTTTYLGELVEQTGTTTTEYVFAGGQRIAALETSGSVAASPPLSRWARLWRTVWDLLDIPSAEAAGPLGLRFYHPDHLGSSNVITDATGALVEQTEHLPFGAIARHTGTTTVAHQFTGQRQDVTTGLILFPARAYDPQLGRFIQADPLVQNPADPQTLNRYSYVRNNPINLVDPTGHFWFIIAAIVEFIVAHATEIAIAAATTAAAAAISNEMARQRESQTSPSAPPAVAPQNLTLGQRWNNLATNPAVAGTASAYAGFVPGAGELQDYWAARYGVDVFTNEQIPWGWRLAAGVMLFIPLVGTVQVRQGARALNEEVSKGAEYVYDATVKRYRHVKSGRFVAGRNLPHPADHGFRFRTRGTLQPGAVVDRYGRPSGRFASEPGASMSARGLPPGSEALKYNRYEVMRPLDVDMGPAAEVPEFAATGGAPQYRFGRPISELEEEGDLRRLP